MKIFEIYMASDHAGRELRGSLFDLLEKQGHIVHDLGAGADEGRVDYPDYGKKLAQAMKPFKEVRGVLVCGSGVGISIAANRFSWIRCALCHDVEGAILARSHNDANVIAFGERVIDIGVARASLEAFLATDFEGGRHIGRVEKLGQLTED